MEVGEFQEQCSNIVNRLDEKYNISRDEQLNVSQLVEELGELVKEINKKKLRNKDPEQKDLEEEFADVLLQLMKLADLFKVDVEKAVLEKIEVLKKRHDL